MSRQSTLVDPGAFFIRGENTKPFVKIALTGFRGGGKSNTAAKVGIGLAKRIGSTKPIMVVDTELSWFFLVSEFLEAGLPEPLRRETTTFADLEQAMDFMDAGLSEVLIVDQTARFYGDFEEAYKLRPTFMDPPRARKTHLEIEDRMVIIEEWRNRFAERFTRGLWHGILCGRAGYRWEKEKDEETGRRVSFHDGVKMKGGSEDENEPDLVALMEHEEVHAADFDQASGWVNRMTVVKDRSRKLHGKSFDNPTYETFQPFIEVVLQNPSSARSLPYQRTGLSFQSDESRREYRQKCGWAVEDIEGVLQHAIPGQAAKDKQQRVDILFKVFGVHSDEWKSMPLNVLRDGYRSIQNALVDLGFAEWRTADHYVGKRFVVKGMEQEIEPVSRVAGNETAAEAVPTPLREAHKGMDKAVLADEWLKSDFSGLTTQKGKAFMESAIQFGWTPRQFSALLTLRDLPATSLDVSKSNCDWLSMQLARGPEEVLADIPNAPAPSQSIVA